ncbi:MAG: hypothetical protein ACLPHP_10560 [Candidatus Sulfotelmatobacter sp.]
MPRPDDHSDGSSTLPPPELNPLLNPLLAQNMGRWAEVYFTSPPEKREQAVLDLLRELQGDNPASEVTARSPVSDQENPRIAAPGSLTADIPAEVAAAVVYCQACGRENPASHRFCGMCGAPMAAPRSAADLNITDLHVANHVPDHVADLPIANLHDSDLQRADLQRGDPQTEYPPGEDRQVAHLFAEDPVPLSQSHPVQNHEEGFVPSARAASEPAWSTHEFLSARGGEFDDRDNRTSNLFEPAPASRPYGLYAGIAVVVVLALAYVAWRSMQTSQSSRAALQAPPAVTTQPAAPSPEPALSKADSPEPIPDRRAELASPAKPDAAVPANGAADPRHADSVSNAVKAMASLGEATEVVIPTGGINEKSLQSEPVSANGAQELAMAQRYLNGAEGQERNSSEAAKWLWKAIAKHNADATLLLSDLYLKGDGVEKNCDQARVLLDAAAGRGMKGAGDRLRHLQAFGCQ